MLEASVEVYWEMGLSRGGQKSNSWGRIQSSRKQFYSGGREGVEAYFCND